MAKESAKVGKNFRKEEEKKLKRWSVFSPYSDFLSFVNFDMFTIHILRNCYKK